MAIKIFFDFITSKHGKRYIEEPEGLASADFTLEQEEGRFGRDVSFAGGESKFTIYALPNHCLKEMLYNKEYFGYEAIVKLGFEFDEDTVIIGEVDFYTANTDGVSKFEFTVIEESQRAILKTRYDAKTNLFSATDLSGNPILPVPYTSMLLKAKPIRQKSIWKNPTLGKSYQIDPILDAEFFNPVKQQLEYAIPDSLSWLEDFNYDTGANFIHVRAVNNLLNLEIEVKHKVTWQYFPFLPASQHQGFLRLRVVWGQTIGDGINAGQTRDLYYNQIKGTDNVTVTLPEIMSTTIPFVNATDNIWIGYTVGSNGSSQIITFQESTTTIIASSVAFNTVVPCIRIIDAIKYVAKSVSGLNVIAPRYDAGGELFNQYITTTSLMRRLFDKPVNISFKDIVEEWLVQEMADYAIRSDNSIFIGFYRDYYANVEIGSYEQEITDDYNDYSNDRYGVNIFKYGYKNTASQKEIQNGTTYDIVHGSAEYLNGNIKAKNTKDVNVGIVRDAFLLEKYRSDSYNLSKDTATQDDDKIFEVDVVPLTESDREYIHTAFLQHRVDNGFLYLRNTSNFSWEQLGLSQGQFFYIQSGSNQGVYIIQNIEETELKLAKVYTPAPINILGQNTTFKYSVSNSVTLVNRTNEGFDIIENIEEPDNYANLRFTVARNVRKYCSEYMATCIMYSKEKPYINTVYNNNPDAITRLITSIYSPTRNFSIREGDDYTPKNPILEPTIITTNLIMNRKEFLILRDRARNENGFIRTHKTNGMPVKLYPKKITWTSNSKNPNSSAEDIGYALIDGEVKYERFYLDIFGTGSGVIVINNQEIGVSEMNYEIDAYENLLIFDENGKLMFYPTPYNRVKVNNSGQATSAVQLEQWLNAIL